MLKSNLLPNTNKSLHTRWLNAALFLYITSNYLFNAIPGLSKLNLLFVSLLGILLFHQALRYSVKIPRLSYIPWLFFLYALISLFWSYDPDVALWGGNGLASIFTSLLGATMVWLALANGGSWRAVLAAFIVGAMLNIFAASGEILSLGLSGRVEGISGNANMLGLFLLLAAVAILLIPISKPGWITVFPAFFMLVGLLYTGSRKVLFTLAIIIVYHAIQFSRQFNKLRNWIIVSTVVTLLVIGSLAAIDSTTLLDKFADINLVSRTQLFIQGKDVSANIRADMAIDALQIWKKSPWFGLGVGHFAIFSSYKTYSHNNITELLVNLGIVGLLLYYLFYVVIIWVAVVGTARGSEIHLRALILMVVILMLDTGLVSYVSKISWTFLIITAHLSFSSPIPKRKRRHRSFESKPLGTGIN